LSDALDTIFQKIYSLKNFRKFFVETPYIAHAYGVQPTLIGTVLLNKLVTFCYFKNLNLMREGLVMASELFFSVFKVTLPHPFIPIKYGEYRLREILPKERVLDNKYVLDPAELTVACNNHAINLIDIEEPCKALPIICFMEYLATEILQ
jgi:hypothetical protein